MEEKQLVKDLFESFNVCTIDKKSKTKVREEKTLWRLQHITAPTKNAGIRFANGQ
ncbi:MAG: hypothetical protein K0S26_504 [Bacteroidota bacterium]|nr:hypothetical protein [Bacteroidota bacterium]